MHASSDGGGWPRAAIVLAAGEGSRLRPLTDRIPKPLLPIDGEPVLGRVLRQLRDVGVRDATVVVGRGGRIVREFVSGTAERPHVRFVEQGERRGTAHALQLATADAEPVGPCVVCAADTAWRDDDVAALVEGHASARPLATMALLRWPVEQLPHHSRVRVDAEGLVERVLDRVDPSVAAAGERALAGSPLYVFEPAMWRRVAAVRPVEPGGVVELWRALQGAIDGGTAVRGHEIHGARDLTRPDDLLRANFPYLRPWLDEAGPRP